MNIGTFKEHVQIAYNNKNSNAKLSCTMPSMLSKPSGMLNFNISTKFKTVLDHQLVFESWETGKVTRIGKFNNILSVEINRVTLNLRDLTEEDYFQLSTIQDISDFSFEDLMYIKYTFYQMQEDFKDYIIEQERIEIKRIEEFHNSMKELMNSSKDLIFTYHNKGNE